MISNEKVYTDRKGTMLVICGPSGAGKSTLIQKLMLSHPRLILSVSWTTRKPRKGELEGKDYHFCDDETFMQHRDDDFFLEKAFVHGHWYGTPRLPVENLLVKGFDVIFDIDVQGAKQIREKNLENIHFAFIMPPSISILKDRLQKRGEKAESMTIRLENAKKEIEVAKSDGNYLMIINEDISKAYDDLLKFYHQATDQNIVRI